MVFYINPYLPLASLNLENSQLTSLVSESISIGFWDGLLILCLSAIAGYLLRIIFRRYSITYSSKEEFGNTILIVTIGVSALIAVVKSSLALSLGLVGALSVVRFRTAVKEPFNLAYVFFAICIGISIGASQFLFALMLLLVGAISVYLIYHRGPHRFKPSLYTMDTLVIQSKDLINSGDLASLISQSFEDFSIVSYSTCPEDGTSMTARVNTSGIAKIDLFKENIENNYPSIYFSFFNSLTH